MEDTITIKKSEVIELAENGKGLALTRDAEESLIKLLDLKDFIDNLVENVKSQIAERAKEKYPDFKGVQGNRIKAVYRAYGDKYQSDNPEFQKEIVQVRTDGKKIEQYIEENGVLPDGVVEKVRTEKLVISRL